MSLFLLIEAPGPEQALNPPMARVRRGSVPSGLWDSSSTGHRTVLASRGGLGTLGGGVGF